MAFYINDSANTSHPLMDAIVKYSKIIIEDMVLKNEEVANNYETKSSMEWSDYFMAVKNGSMRLSFFPPTRLYEYLQEYGYSAVTAYQLATDPSKIPDEESHKILEYCNNKFLEDYEEENLYYRRLNGLPPYGTDEYDVYIDYETYGPYLDIDDAATDFDFSRPIHEYSVTEITSLEYLGIMDLLYEKYITNNEDRESREAYKYLRFLGGRKIDVYEARIASNWDILYMPPADIYVVKRFRELYAVNRDVYERKIDQLAYSVRSDHFQEMVMFMIVCQTFNDMIVDTPEWYIRRDIIDLRSVEYFLESQGVKFFEDIPMRYQIRIVKNLNRLIRYKSTDKNIADILEIFASEDAQIYQYYLLKKYKTTDLNQHTITGIPPLPEVWHLQDEYDYGYEEDPPEPDPEDPDNPEEEDGGDEDSDPILGDNAELIHDPSVIYDEDGNEIYDFQDFDDPDYIVDNEILYMYDFETEENPNILPVGALPEDEYGNQVLDGWWEDSEFDHEGDEDHTEILNSTGDGYGNDMVGDDPLGEPYETYDFGMDSATSEKDDLADFEEYIYDFGWDDEHIIDDYKTTQKKEEYEQSTRIIKDKQGNIYDLEFIKVPIDDQYDNYIKDSSYRVDYDEITLYDKYWDGEDTHSYIKNQHLDSSYYDNGVWRAHDYTIEGTKFMGLEYDVSLTQFSYEQTYYLGMLLNTKIDISDINIGIPSIKPNTYFNIRNIILFLYCCNGLYTGEDIDVNDPSHAVIKRVDNDIPEFEAYYDIDGGYVWTGDGKGENEKEEEWSVPSIDFGTFDPDDEERLRNIIDCGDEGEYVHFDLEFDGDILDYGSEEYYVVPAHMDHEYDFGNEEENPNKIIDMTGAKVYDFDYDSKFPIDNTRDYSNLWEFGNEDGYELFEDYDDQIIEYQKQIKEEDDTYYSNMEVIEGDDEDIPKDEWYDYNSKENLEFGYEDLEEYMEKIAPDYTNYIFPYDDVSNDPTFRQDLLIDGRDEDEVRARVQDEVSEMGDEDYVQYIDFTEPQYFENGDYDFGFFNELHPIGDRPMPVAIPTYWLESGIDECGDESPEVVDFPVEDAIFGDEDLDTGTDEYLSFEGPNEDDAHPDDITACADYGNEDDGMHLIFIGDDYDCGDEETVKGIMDMSNAIDMDFNTFQWDYDAMSEEEKTLYYEGINGGNEDNSELEPVPGSIFVSMYDKANGYDREDDDVMNIVYDFGYHYDFDPFDTLYDYDYGEITPNSIDSDEALQREMTEKQPYFHNMDFGYEDKESLIYTQYTVVYEMGDYISEEANNRGVVYNAPAILGDGEDDIIDSGNIEDEETPTEDQEEEWEIWDFGEITEDSDDTIEPDEKEYDEETFNFYTDEKYFHILYVTEKNYTSIIGQYYINQKNGDLSKITPENADSYIGRLISYLDWWWNIEDHYYYEEDYDGHSPGQLDLVINYYNYEMIIGQKYVDPLTGEQHYISREKALSYTYHDVTLIIIPENKNKFVNSEYYNPTTEKYEKITWNNIDDLVRSAAQYNDSRITIKVNIENYKKFIGSTYIDPESDDEMEFTYEFGQNQIQTIVSILDWYWNTDNRDFVETYYLNADGGKLPYCLVTQASYYDYIRTDHSLMFKDCMGRIYGFNMAVELEQLEDDIGFNHSKFGFERSYTLADMGCDSYIVQRKFSDLRDLYRVYENNTKCYNKLKDLYENAGTRDEKRVMEYVFYTLFTRPYDMEFYIVNNGDIAVTYDQVLAKHDNTLYKKYLELQNEVNATTRIYNVRNIMNDLVDTLSYYMNSDTLKYALSFIYTCSFDAMLTYIQEMIDFFKSWKVQFIGHKINYLLDDKMNNMAIYGDQIGELKTKYWGAANGFMADAVRIQTLYFPEDNKDMTKDNFNASVIDTAVHYVDDDIFMDRDFDGGRLGQEDIYADEPQLELNGGRLYIIIDGENQIVRSELDDHYYIQANGGRVDRFIDLQDLDGGGVRDIRDNGEYVDANVINDGTVGYADIDGGNFSEKYIGYDYMIGGKINPEIGISRKPYDYRLADPKPQNQVFKSYDVNGGIPNIHTIYTDTAVTKISDFNEVSVDVRLAPIESNGLEVVYTEDGEPPVWPMRNIDFGYEDKPDEIFDYGDLDNPGDTFIIGKMDVYGNEDESIASTENAIRGVDDYANDNDEFYLNDIDIVSETVVADYGDLDNPDDTMELYKDIYGNEDESPNAAENLVTGLDDYYDPNDDYSYLLSYVDNRRSKNNKIYEFGNEDVDNTGYITDETIEGELVYDYGEILSTTEPSEDFVEPDYNHSNVGLYFDYTKYASNTSITNNTNAITNYGETYAKELAAMITATKMVRDKESIEKYIQDIFDKKMESMAYVLNKFRAGDQPYIDGFVNYNEAIYRENLFFWYNEVEPFVWTDFAGNKIRRTNSA